MGITKILRKIWLFSANKIESSESGSKQPNQLILKINSSLRHIIVTNEIKACSHRYSSLYSYYDEKWHGYFTTPLLTSIEMSNAQTVQEILNYGANIKIIAKTSHGGDLGAKYLIFFLISFPRNERKIC